MSSLRTALLLGALSVVALGSGTASAFCGTYAGSAGSTPTNRASQVVLVREGRRTTITMANDVVSAGTSLSMLIPVPGDVDPADVRLVDIGLMERVDKYAAPRLVEYTCDDLHGGDKAVGCAGCAGDLAKGLLSRFAYENLPGFLESAGLADAAIEYEVLSPSSVEELSGASTLVGREISTAASPLIQEQIDAGSSFISVKIDLREAGLGALWLPPIQFAYESDNMVLPIKLGTTSSAGVQDVILHVITGGTKGQVGISNYAEMSTDAECMWDREGLQSFSGFWNEKVDAAFVEAGGTAAFMTEYVWGPTACDPCTGAGPLGEQDLKDLGYEGDPTQATLTRLHARFVASAVEADLMLYPTNSVTNQQYRFIAYDETLESDFPVCGEGFVDNPGSCEAEDTALSGSAPLPVGWIVLAGGGLVGLARRRRGDPGRA